MERKNCFGSIRKEVVRDGLTMSQSKPECRDCPEFRECLHYGDQLLEEKKERDELRKQDMITHILDLSHIISNEVGSCILEFLNRIYGSPLGAILFRNLLLFVEIPKDASFRDVAVPFSPSLLELIGGEDAGAEESADSLSASKERILREGFTLRIILIQKHFSSNRKANIGFIAHEVIRMFASNHEGMSQIYRVLAKPESNQLKAVNSEQRVVWLMEKWGFREELMEFRREITAQSAKSVTHLRKG